MTDEHTGICVGGSCAGRKVTAIGDWFHAEIIPDYKEINSPTKSNEDLRAEDWGSTYTDNYIWTPPTDKIGVWRHDSLRGPTDIAKELLGAYVTKKNGGRNGHR